MRTINTISFLIIIIIVILINILLIAVIHRKTNYCNSLNDKLEQAQILNLQLKENINSSFRNQGYKLKNIEISCNIDNSNAKSFSESISQPCLIIYIPYSEDICMTCIHFAITKVKTHFSNFSTNSNIYIISSRYNPKISSRIYQKEIYHFTQKTMGFDIAADKVLLPHYFIVDSKLVITSFFTPNSSYPDLTNDYLISAKKFLFNYEL